MSDDPDSWDNILRHKIPFFIAGVLFGVGIFWLALRIASMG